ncbi:MAG: NADH-quinone oxidoreductase subunit K [Rubrobacter sp.]|nr:NADH-quinone oxidoreductase subunit K [Rubrobacter sp.]
MSSVDMYLLSGVAVFAVCAYALVVHAHLVRKVIAINMMGSGVFVLLTAIARRGESIDPVPHAMVLTGIVVAVSATAFALAVVRKLHETTGSAYLPEEGEDAPPNSGGER